MSASVTGREPQNSLCSDGVVGGDHLGYLLIQLYKNYKFIVSTLQC